MGEAKTCLTDFKVYAFHVAGCLGNVDVGVVLHIRGDGEDLGAQLERVAFCVLRLGCLAGCLVQGGAARVSSEPKRMGASYVVWK